jgi:hypothetical protein
MCYLNLSKVIHHIVLFRYSKRHLWEQFFYTLLNVESCAKLPDVSELRRSVEAEILSNKHFSDLTHVRNILGGKWNKLVNWTLMIGYTPMHLRSLNYGHFGFCQLNVTLKYVFPSVILLWTIPYSLTVPLSMKYRVSLGSCLYLKLFTKWNTEKNQYHVIYCTYPQSFLVLRWIWLHYELDILTIISGTAKVEQSYIFCTLYNKIISCMYVLFLWLLPCVVMFHISFCM